MNINYKDLILSDKQINVLKRASKRPIIARPGEWERTLKFLVRSQLIEHSQSWVVYAEDEEPQQPTYRITDAGRMWLSYHRRAWWKELRAWLTLGISLAAFIKSFFF